MDNNPLFVESVYIKAYRNFVNHVEKKNVQINNAIDLLKSLILIMEDFGHLTGPEKKLIVIQIIEDIAAGTDGILNTQDDLMSPYILKSLELLIQSNVIPSTIDLICEVTHTKTCCSFLCYFKQFFCCCLPYKKLSI
jgi:hypothetical protein